MSLNLHCLNTTTNEMIPLRQTPTKASFAIFNEGRGDNQAVLERYESWLLQEVKACNPKASTYYLKILEQEVKDEILQLKEQLTPLSNFKFFVN